jgi:hypothetical protein
MMKLRAKSGLAGRLRDVRSMLSRLKQWRLSPLSAILLAVLTTITAGTALFAAAAVLWPVRWDEGAAAPDWNPPTLAVVELDPPKPPSADVEALSRPIFAKNRKPSPKSAASAVDPTTISEAPTDLAVTAIVKSKKVAQAFVTSPETPEGAWRKVGDTVGAWTLHKILHAEVVFQNGDQMTKVKLYAPPPDAPGEQPQQEGFFVKPEATPDAPAAAEAPPAPDAPQSAPPN